MCLMKLFLIRILFEIYSNFIQSGLMLCCLVNLVTKIIKNKASLFVFSLSLLDDEKKETKISL